MRDTPERDLAVAQELGSMAEARIRELEDRCAALQAQLDATREQNDVYARTLAAHWEECDVEDFRRRAVEAARLLDCRPENAFSAVTHLLQSLPATEDRNEK